MDAWLFINNFTSTFIAIFHPKNIIVKLCNNKTWISHKGEPRNQ